MKKSFIWFFVVIVMLAGLATGVYFYLNRSEDTSFTTTEQQWIEDNKTNRVQFHIPSDIAGLTHNGNGVFFDFLGYFTSRTGLTITPIAYRHGEELTNVEYAIEVVNSVSDNQLEVLTDHFVIITRENKTFSTSSGLANKRIGVLIDNEEYTRKYLVDSDIEFVVFDTEEELNLSLAGTDEYAVEIDGVIVLRSIYLGRLLTEDIFIAYHITDMIRYYVITLDGDETLNRIIEKSYISWSRNRLDAAYNNFLLEAYFSLRNVSERDQTTLWDKSYIYGSINNGIFDFTRSGRPNGINQYIINSFANFANIDITYDIRYSSIDELSNSFNNGNIDFVFGNSSAEFMIEHVTTAASVRSEIAVLSNTKNTSLVRSLNSLYGQNVDVVKGTRIAEHLKSYGINTVEHIDLKTLLNNTGKDTIIAIDLKNYEFHKTSELANFKVNYIFTLNEPYHFVINANNQVFAELFDFYLEYMSIENLVADSYAQIYTVDNTVLYLYLIIVLMSIVIIIQFVYYINRLVVYFKKKRGSGFTLSKAEKIKYVDSLTSLKNRNYFSDNIEKWDNSEIYPQAVVVIDLNNISYINDNFGHEEGDKVIAQAASILIKNQMSKTEIMRTDGNEFLIYMVEYDEKQVSAYVKKLNKELKELSHDFGAAVGYSTIADAIKTIDDAVNEALLDMRANKEAMLEE